MEDECDNKQYIKTDITEIRGYHLLKLQKVK